MGVRGSDGRVHVPPAEYDPVTYEPLGEIVPVSSVGTVASWTWQPEPLEGQPLDRPFAWALIKLDGADTLLMHAVDAGEPGRRSAPARGYTRTGPTRRWVRSPTSPTSRSVTKPKQPSPSPSGRPRPGHHDRHADLADDPAHRFARGERLSCGRSRRASCSARGRAKTARCTSRRTAPTRPPACRPTEFVELPDKGTVTTFAIINIPFPGQRIKPPYVAAYVLLDGADIPFLHLVADIDAHRGADGHAGRGGVEAPRGVGPWHRQHRVLPAYRANPTPTTTPTSTTCKGLTCK